jgi:glycosyltransferase involved in cell wall biosynthesis
VRTRVVAAASVAASCLTGHALLNCRLLRRPPPARVVREAVSVLLPVRDEAGRLAPCLAALLGQQHLADGELLVYDDASADGTADLVEQMGGDRLRLLRGTGPPPGRLGKPHACAQLAAAARGQVLVFVDADVVCAADAVARSVLLLRDSGLDWVSPYPRQLADGLLPRLVQPLLQWSWLTFLPVRLAESLPYRAMAAANGQLLAVDADAYRRAGGHPPDAVLDDLALARRLRTAGYRGGFADGTDLATCRMYDSGAEVVAGYGKSLRTAFGQKKGWAAAVILLGWLYVLPPIAALRGSRWGLTGYLAAVAGRVLVARRTGGRMVDGWLHPASIGVFVGLVVRSRRRAGPPTWKGRPVECG